MADGLPLKMDTPLDKVEKKIDSALTRNPKLLVVTPLSVVALLSYFSGVLGWGPILPCLVVAGLLMALSSRQKRADIVRLAWLRGESRRMRVRRHDYLCRSLLTRGSRSMTGRRSSGSTSKLALFG